MTRREREPVHIHDVTAIRDSGKALLCNIDGDEIWIPHSQVHDDSEVFDAEENAEGTLVITAWLAEQKGLA